MKQKIKDFQITEPLPSSVDNRRGPKTTKSIPQLSAAAGVILSDRDAKKWLSLIEIRGSKDPLFNMTDRIQAGMVMTGILTIQGIYAGVEAIVSERGGKFTVDDLNKLTNSLNRAMASVNQSLHHLGITGKERKEPVDVDSLATSLTRYIHKDEIPPGLEKAYVAAKLEIERISGEGVIAQENEGLSGSRSDILSALKQPLKSYVESEDEERPTVIDVEKEGLEVLR